MSERTIPLSDNRLFQLLLQDVTGMTGIVHGLVDQELRMDDEYGRISSTMHWMDLPGLRERIDIGNRNFVKLRNLVNRPSVSFASLKTSLTQADISLDQVELRLSDAQQAIEQLDLDWEGLGLGG